MNRSDRSVRVDLNTRHGNVAETRHVTMETGSVSLDLHTPVYMHVHLPSPLLPLSITPSPPFPPFLPLSAAPVWGGGRGLGATAAAGGQVSAGGSEFSVEPSAGGASLTVAVGCWRHRSYVTVINTNQPIGCRWVSDEVRQTPSTSSRTPPESPDGPAFVRHIMYVSIDLLSPRFVSLLFGFYFPPFLFLWPEGGGVCLGAGEGADHGVLLWCLTPHVC